MLLRTIIIGIFVLFCFTRGDYLLYSEGDNVVILGVNNIEDFVLESDNMWMVEFYNSYCGHCTRFAAAYKALATATKDWHPVMRIGAMACSVPANSDMCRKQNITGYPALKFYKDNSKNLNAGELYEGEKEKEDMQPALIDYIESFKPELRPKACPSLQPIRSLEELSSLTTVETQHTAVIFETSSSYIGRKLQLDMVSHPELLVRRMVEEDAAKYSIAAFPSLYMVDKRGNIHLIAENAGRPQLRQALYNLMGREYNESPSSAGEQDKRDENKEVEDTAEEPEEDELDQPNNLLLNPDSRSATKVYMQDLLSGLSFSLRHEVALKNKISGEAFQALRHYMNTLSTYFPGPDYVNQYLSSVSQWLRKRDVITGEQWVQGLNNLQTTTQYLPEGGEWSGCRGSQSRYRGYPCSMWMLFHSLTVDAVVSHPEVTRKDPTAVLLAINGYMDHFFGCRECSSHFVKKPSEIIAEVSTLDDTIVYLWQSHNRANLRLHGDLTEDPDHVKVQFPSPVQCPECRVTNEESDTEDWEVQEVITFLKHMYTQENIVRGEASTSSRDQHNAQLKGNEWLQFKGDIVQRQENMAQLRKKKSYKKMERQKQLEEKWKDKLNVGDNQFNMKLEELRETELSTRLLGNKLGLNYMDISMCVLFYIVSTGIVMLFFFHFSYRRRWRNEACCNLKHLV